MGRESDEPDRARMVSVVLNEGDDSRLRGWEQTTPLDVPDGLTWRVRAVEKRSSGGVIDKSETLWVRLETASQDGPWIAGHLPIIFKRPGATPKAVSLEALETLFLNALDGQPIPVWLEVTDRWGPNSNWPNFEHSADQLIFDQFVALRSAMANPDPDGSSQQRIARMAYSLGRAVREREIVNRHGARIDKQQEGARAGGERTGTKKREDAETWHYELAQWANDLQAREPMGKRPMSFAKLADLIHEKWQNVELGPADPPTSDYLTRELLPRLVKKGWLKRFVS